MRIFSSGRREVASGVHVAGVELTFARSSAGIQVLAGVALACESDAGGDVVVVDRAAGARQWECADVENGTVIDSVWPMKPSQMAVRRNPGASWASLRLHFALDLPAVRGTDAGSRVCLVFPEMLPRLQSVGHAQAFLPPPRLHLANAEATGLSLAGIAAEPRVDFARAVRFLQVIAIVDPPAGGGGTDGHDVLLGPKLEARLGPEARDAITSHARRCMRQVESCWGLGSPIRIAFLDPEDVPGVERRVSGACLLQVPRRLPEPAPSAVQTINGATSLSQAVWDGGCRVRGPGWRELALGLTIATGHVAARRFDPEFRMELLHQKFARYPARERLSDGIDRIRGDAQAWRSNMIGATISRKLDEDAGVRVALRGLLAECWGGVLPASRLRAVLAESGVVL